MCDRKAAGFKGRCPWQPRSLRRDACAQQAEGMVCRERCWQRPGGEPIFPTMSADFNKPSDSPPTANAVSRGVWARVRDAALLDGSVYDEVARDRRATRQAACVVILASLAVASIDYPLGWIEMAQAAAAAVLQWLVWAAMAHIVGGRILGGNADWGALIRVLGFARGPGVFAVLAPLVGGIHLAAQAWVLVAGTAALRAAMGFGTGRALVTSLVGMVPYWSVQLFYLH